MENDTQNADKFIRQAYIKSELSKRFSGLNLTKRNLLMVEEILERYRYKNILEGVQSDTSLYFIIWAGVIIKFTSCFSSDQSRTKLNPDKIYTNQNGLREMYQIIDDIRDKNIAHDVNSMYDDKAIVDLDDNASATRVSAVSVLSGMRSDIYPIILKLVKVAIVSIEFELDGCRKNLLKEVHAMTPEQRVALPPWSYDTAAGMTNFTAPRRR